MRAMAGTVKLVRRCRSSYRICQMRPITKPSASAAKISKAVANIPVI
jgi:hypothetical protein